MKYDLSAILFPVIFDRYAYALFRKEGVHISRRKVHTAYRAMVRRTPDLPEGSAFTGNLLMGCYVLSFWKAYPERISEDLFHQLVLTLCRSRPMVNGHRNENAFDEKELLRKEQNAPFSGNPDYEMDWQYTFQRNESSYDLIYTKCGLCRLGRRENCFHLIRYLCEADYITYDLMGADLERTKTIACGDHCCDFHVCRKEQ